MANAVRTVLLSEPARTKLRRRVRAKGLPARDVERARIALLAAEGRSGVQIAERVGCSELAALEVATGKVTDTLDNCGSHKHPKVNTWLAKNPRITLHFTPTSGSWLNLVEVFFGIITRQAIRRGTVTSVADPEHAIGVYIDTWNERCGPFTWTKDADTILAKAVRRGSHGTASAATSVVTT